jgi:transposase
VAIETVGFYRWLWTEAEPLVDQLVLCDARGARALAGRRIKTDRAQSERRISELMRAPEFAGLRKTLESVPGVGLVTSATVIAEIGDFRRFGDSKAIGRYAGLAPTVYASGNSNRLGHISKTGSPDLRWVLQQAA